MHGILDNKEKVSGECHNCLHPEEKWHLKMQGTIEKFPNSMYNVHSINAHDFPAYCVSLPVVFV